MGFFDRWRRPIDTPHELKLNDDHEPSIHPDIGTTSQLVADTIRERNGEINRIDEGEEIEPRVSLIAAEASHTASYATTEPDYNTFGDVREGLARDDNQE